MILTVLAERLFQMIPDQLYQDFGTEETRSTVPVYIVATGTSALSVATILVLGTGCYIINFQGTIEKKKYSLRQITRCTV